MAIAMTPGTRRWQRVWSALIAGQLAARAACGAGPDTPGANAPITNAPGLSVPEPDSSAPVSRSTAAPLAPPSATNPALGDDVSAQLSEADERYRRAVELYDDGAYDAALRELERVYTLAPMFRVLYNLGIVSLALRDYARAMSYFERYLAEGRTAIDADVRADVSDTLRSLAGRVAFITIDTSVAGAEVSIDDVPVGLSPLPAPVRVNAGSRRITAQVPGRLPVSRVVGLAGGDETRVSLTLVEPNPQPETVEPGRPFPWLAWASTAVLAGGAVYCTTRAFALQDRYTDKQGELGVTRAELDALDHQVTAFSVAADTLAVASLAAAGYSLYLTLWSKPASPERDDAKREGLSLQLGIGHARLNGSF
jgi:tetratricopeptide (TPR) repeat protein